MREENNNHIIDTDFEEVEEEIYLTAPQIAQKIKDTDIRVRYWADAFGDLIGIEKSSNGRKRYKESDVSKFAFIKELIDTKNFKHEQVREHLTKHGFQYAKLDSGLVNPKDPLGFQALASALSVEVKNQLNEFLKQYTLAVSDELNKFKEQQQQMNLEMKAEIEASVDEIVSEKMGQVIREVEATRKEAESINKMRMELEEKKKDEKNKNRGFFKKWFKK